MGIDRIERIALVVGPGSFTGLRVGLAFVKGMYAALDLDVVIIDTLELLALPVIGDHSYVCPMIDARKSEVYTAVYRAIGPIGKARPHAAEVVEEPKVLAPEALLDEVARFSPLFVGSGALCYRDLITEAVGEGHIASDEASSPSVEYLCRVASRLVPLSDEEVCSLEPLYIRSSDAELKRLKPIDPHA